MASGRLGVAAPAADTNASVYTVPATKLASMAINICNRGTSVATVRLAIAATDTPAVSEYIEYDVELPANGGVLERTAIIAGAGERVVVRASTANCSVRVHGYEETI